MKKKKMWLIVVAVVIFLTAAFTVSVALRMKADSTPAKIPDLSNPHIMLSFSPEPISPREASRIDKSASMYPYDLSTAEIGSAIPWGETRYCDLDEAGQRLLGLVGDAVVASRLADGTPYTIGPADYAGERLVWHTLRWHPNGQDYSGLTERGKLILYHTQAGNFEYIADFEELWNGYSFGYSWVDDGKNICVPDAAGIALLDMETKVQHHWITVPIFYPNGGSTGFPHTRKAFEVSNDRCSIIYINTENHSNLYSTQRDGTKKYRTWEHHVPVFAQIDAGGEIEERTPLSDRWDGTFALSPDGTAVAFSSIKAGNTLFTTNYYEVNLYRDGWVKKLFNACRTEGSMDDVILW